MNIYEQIKRLFTKQKPIRMKYCTCKQQVAYSLYNKELKAHRIGKVQTKEGEIFTIYCNGEDI